MRTGLVAKKLGMTQIFIDSGVQVPLTVLEVFPSVVISQKLLEKDGYNALQLACCPVSANKLSKPLRGFFSAKNIEPYKIIKEFRVDASSLLPVNQQLDVSHFLAGTFVDVTGFTIGKGFAGSMKRHNFGGLRASHGVSVSHRSHGSTGNRQDPGKVFKNKKMAGHMGCKKVTKLNLLVHDIDQERGLLFIKGAVPGSKNSYLYIRDAIKNNS